jgi:hypothetical protein
MTMPIILATLEAKMGRIMVQGQLRQIGWETPISKITTAKLGGGVAQAIEHTCFSSVKPAFKPQSHQKTNTQTKTHLDRVQTACLVPGVRNGEWWQIAFFSTCPYLPSL